MKHKSTLSHEHERTVTIACKPSTFQQNRRKAMEKKEEEEEILYRYITE